MGLNYFEFADDVCASLYQNLDTLANGTITQNLWTDATAALNRGWQITNPNTPYGESPISEQIANLSEDGSKAAKDALAKFLNDHLTDQSYLYDFCMQDITALYGKLSKDYDTTAGPTQMSMIQQFGNLISATQQIETSTGETETKAQASFMQQAISSTQPVSDLGNSVIGVLTTLGSIMMQSFL